MPTDLLTLLTQIFAGLTLLALIWLVARAFRRHPAWGCSVLLLSPIAAAVFGIKHWHKEKFPFLAYITLFAVTLGLVASLFGAWGGWDLIKANQIAHEGVKTHTLTQADADAFRQASLTFNNNSGIHYTDEALQIRIRRQLERDEKHQAFLDKIKAENEPQDTQSLSDLFRRKPAEQERSRLVYKPIKLREARDYVGSTVKITRKGALEKEYRLTGASRGKLHLAQKTRGGSFSFSLKSRDIEKIRVLTKQHY